MGYLSEADPERWGGGGVVSQHESLGGSEGCATAEKYNSVDCEIRYLDCLSPSHTGGGGAGIIKITVLN